MMLSSQIMQHCAFLQNQIQQILFKSHGPDLDIAKETLRKFPNPRGRFEYLCNFPYQTADKVVNTIFNYTRAMFASIYDIRNVLAHEVWHSSDEYPSAILFSTLEDNASLLAARGSVLHDEEASPRAVYDATMRYIRKVKVVDLHHLKLASADIDLCNWSLMNTSFVLDQDDEERREEARQAFYVFRGTAHLFRNQTSTSKPVNYRASSSKKITGDTP